MLSVWICFGASGSRSSSRCASKASSRHLLKRVVRLRNCVDCSSALARAMTDSLCLHVLDLHPSMETISTIFKLHGPSWSIMDYYILLNMMIYADICWSSMIIHDHHVSSSHMAPEHTKTLQHWNKFKHYKSLQDAFTICRHYKILNQIFASPHVPQLCRATDASWGLEIVFLHCGGSWSTGSRFQSVRFEASGSNATVRWSDLLRIALLHWV